MGGAKATDLFGGRPGEAVVRGHRAVDRGLALGTAGYAPGVELEDRPGHIDVVPGGRLRGQVGCEEWLVVEDGSVVVLDHDEAPAPGYNEVATGIDAGVVVGNIVIEGADGSGRRLT